MTTTPEAWGPSRSRTVEWWDPSGTVASSRGLSGLAFMEGLLAGEFPPPPIAGLMGMGLVRVERGLAVFECEPDESVYNPIGVVHGGLVCTMADSVAGCAVHTTLDPDWTYTSIDITVNYTRAVTLGSGKLVATGRVVKPGRRVALASAEIVDAAGKVVATATSNCLVMAPG